MTVHGAADEDTFKEEEGKDRGRVQADCREWRKRSNVESRETPAQNSLRVAPAAKKGSGRQRNKLLLLAVDTSYHVAVK